MGQPNSINQKNEHNAKYAQNNIVDKIVIDTVDILNETVKNMNNNSCIEHNIINNINENGKNPSHVIDDTATDNGVETEKIQENVNHGKSWTLQEEKDLLGKIDKYTLEELAKMHGRTKGAIEAKLKKIYMESMEKNNLNTQIEKLINVNSIKKSPATKSAVYEKDLNIYIIKCQHDKYYIGKSKNLENRILQHFQEIGSAWTGLHKPIEVVDTIKNADNFDEDKYTKIYMAKYGMDNVRGGSYVQISLSPDVKKYLEKEINSTYDYCYRCGRTDHFINKCNANVHIDGSQLSNSSDKLSATNHPKPNKIKDNTILESSYEKKSSEYCTKCGRRGHTKESCYAKKHVKGFSIK